MNHHNMKYLLGMLLLVAPLMVLAGGTTSREYLLSGHGNLALQVPSGWRDQVKRPAKRMPPTITFSPKSGNLFQVIVTPIWSHRKDHKLPSGRKIRPLVESSIQDISRQAVEQSIAPREITGKQGGGYYFSATSKSPKPGDFKYLSQGMIRIGELLTTFTILSKDGAEKDVQSALAMIRGARQIK